SSLCDPVTRVIGGGGELADAWPANASENQYDRVRTSKVNTLLIGGALDFATPPQIATKELLPYLPNGHQVVLAGIGHTTSFWTQQRKAGSHLINTFFDSGRVDDSLYKPTTVDFTPDVTLAAFSVGVPVGLCIYFAWLNRGWAAQTKVTGFVAAVGGALVGAWLGFHATEGLLALITAIVGAAVGGNVTLLGLDIAWDRQVRERFAGNPKETLETRPSTG